MGSSWITCMQNLAYQDVPAYHWISVVKSQVMIGFMMMQKINQNNP